MSNNTKKNSSGVLSHGEGEGTMVLDFPLGPPLKSEGYQV